MWFAPGARSSRNTIVEVCQMLLRARLKINRELQLIHYSLFTTFIAILYYILYYILIITCITYITPVDLPQFIVAYGGVVFPNLRISLLILRSVAVSIASCERSFSKLKPILSCLRTSRAQERLCNFALLSIERKHF